MSSGTRRVRGRPPTRGHVTPGTVGGIAGGRVLDKNEEHADTPVGRQLGLDSRDIPGGLSHVLNRETIPARTEAEPSRPLFEGLNAHGVEDTAPEAGYTPTPADVRPAPRPGPEPQVNDAVPVYLVDGPVKKLVLRTMMGDGPMTTVAGGEPIRIADRDPLRHAIYITVEASGAFGTKGIRIGSAFEDLAVGRGLYIGGNAFSPQKFETQDAVWIVAAAIEGSNALAVPVSWAIETDIEVAE